MPAAIWYYEFGEQPSSAYPAGYAPSDERSCVQQLRASIVLNEKKIIQRN